MSEQNRLRREKLQVWLVEEEKELLMRNAASYGLSQSEYIRKLIFAESITGRYYTMDKEQGKRLLYEVNRIGNNINRIAYNTNAKAYAAHADWAELQANFNELLTLLGQVPFLKRSEQEAWKKQAFALLNKSQIHWNRQE